MPDQGAFPSLSVIRLPKRPMVPSTHKDDISLQILVMQAIDESFHDGPKRETILKGLFNEGKILFSRFQVTRSVEDCPNMGMAVDEDGSFVFTLHVDKLQNLGNGASSWTDPEAEAWLPMADTVVSPVKVRPIALDQWRRPERV
ncbi:hypothetical protein AAE478_003941 [Parahypoxylon ruwenzoriense]